MHKRAKNVFKFTFDTKSTVSRDFSYSDPLFRDGGEIILIAGEKTSFGPVIGRLADSWQKDSRTSVLLEPPAKAYNPANGKWSNLPSSQEAYSTVLLERGDCIYSLGHRFDPRRVRNIEIPFKPHSTDTHAALGRTPELIHTEVLS